MATASFKSTSEGAQPRNPKPRRPLPLHDGAPTASMPFPGRRTSHLTTTTFRFPPNSPTAEITLFSGADLLHRRIKKKVGRSRRFLPAVVNHHLI
ncbi:hypothetical protein C2S51_007558 [Perilla frutescens var. frutescens]|nr:hypothetical protein C2S51_007558 [Perilla frutescens var. frutescens]